MKRAMGLLWLRRLVRLLMLTESSMAGRTTPRASQPNCRLQRRLLESAARLETFDRFAEHQASARAIS